MRSVIAKKSRKEERMYEVLLGLVQLYIHEGKPIGSDTLKETGFPHLGSATLRNYFSQLEAEGFLRQEHSSGGRIPTTRAFRLYAQEYVDTFMTTAYEDARIEELRTSPNREVAAYLQTAAETLREITNLAVVLSAPRFDHDFVTHIKLVPVDSRRCLCILLTDFGVIRTEMVPQEHKLSTLQVGRIESYFQWRLTGLDRPLNLSDDEESFAQKLYNELMVRHIVSYSNFTEEEILRTGFSDLLSYPEFQDTNTLASSLSLMENRHSLRLLLKETTSVERLKFWIGEDLAPYAKTAPECAVIAIPYRIGQKAVGAIGVLGPHRLQYRELFAILKLFSDSISEALTRNIYKYKITFRTPDKNPIQLKKEDQTLLNQSRQMLLEDQSKKGNK